MKDRQRDARSFAVAGRARRDLRHAARLLRRNPLFALTAALSLAIGIGANTTIFTVANALLFQPPAGVAEPDRLVDIGTRTDGRRLRQRARIRTISTSARAHHDARRRVRVFALSQPMSLGAPAARARSDTSSAHARHGQLLHRPRRRARRPAGCSAPATASSPDASRGRGLEPPLLDAALQRGSRLVGRTADAQRPSVHGGRRRVRGIPRDRHPRARRLGADTCGGGRRASRRSPSAHQPGC